MKTTSITILILFVAQILQAQHADKFFEQPFEVSSIQLNRTVRSFTSEECESYLKFLETPFPEDKEVSITKEELHGLKDQVADKLFSQASLPDDFNRRFLAMLDNKALSSVWHNYVIQKLDTLYERSADARLRAKILSRLFRETRNPKPTMSGTSLMTLLRLEKKLPDAVDENKLAKRAEWLTEQERYPFQDRLSALHVLAELSLEKAFIPSRKWLRNESSHTMLKTAAIAVLGKSTSIEDIALIQSFQDHPDLRLRTASRNALARISHQHIGKSKHSYHYQ